MKQFCDKPDRDVPKLTCGYPIPCPYHTVVIEADRDEDVIQKTVNTLANLRWLRGRVSISTYFSIGIVPVGVDATGFSGDPVVRIRTVTTWAHDRSGVLVGPSNLNDETVDLPISATPIEIRNATEEQQISARAWLEERYAVPSLPIPPEEIEAMTAIAVLGDTDEKQSTGYKYSEGYLPGCRRPAHRDGHACEGGCTEIVDPAEWRAANPLTARKRRGGTKGQRYKNKR